MKVLVNQEHIQIVKNLFKIEKYKEYTSLEYLDLFMRLFPVSVYPEYRDQVSIEQDITTLFYSQNA